METVERCAAGDIILSPMSEGRFLLRRAIEAEGAGEWWQYVGTVVAEADAISTALSLAAQAGRVAWWHPGDGAYFRIHEQRRRQPGS